MHKFLLVLFAFFSLADLHAQELIPVKDPAEIISKLKEAAASTQTIKADFTEEKFVSYLKEPQKSAGVFYYKKKNRMRWEKLHPSKYVLLVNGSKVQLKENEKEKDVSSFNQIIGRVRELMLTLVNGEFTSNKAFVPTYFQNSEMYVIKLTPRSKRLAGVFQYIQLSFSKQTMRLKELAFFEKSGDKSVMKFYNDKANEAVSDKFFTEF